MSNVQEHLKEGKFTLTLSFTSLQQGREGGSGCLWMMEGVAEAVYTHRTRKQRGHNQEDGYD